MDPQQLANNVYEWLGNKVIEADKPFILNCVKATIDYINTSCPNAPRNEQGSYADSTILGAITLASQLFMRRNSPNGIESITMEGVAYTAKYNPEVSRLLRIDNYKVPMIG